VGESLETYKDVVKRLLHPIGMIMFGQVDILTLSNIRMLLPELFHSLQKLILSNEIDLPFDIEERIIIDLPPNNLDPPDIAVLLILP
jgi:hypothetical protein